MVPGPWPFPSLPANYRALCCSARKPQGPGPGSQALAGGAGTDTEKRPWAEELSTTFRFNVSLVFESN